MPLTIFSIVIPCHSPNYHLIISTCYKSILSYLNPNSYILIYHPPSTSTRRHVGGAWNVGEAMEIDPKDITFLGIFSFSLYP